MTRQISPSEFVAWRDAAQQASGLTPVVLDVREGWELQTASVQAQGFTLAHIPLGSLAAALPGWLDSLPPGQPVACLCHHGMRSMQAAHYLAQHGVHVVNLRGGIDAWAQQFDTSVPLY